MANFLLVGLGGALGAILRYYVSIIIVPTPFPFSTLGVNFLGSLFIGLGIPYIRANSELMGLLFITGFLGAFTTFSTFSLETVELLRADKFILALCYILCSLFICVMATWAGINIGETLVSKFKL